MKLLKINWADGRAAIDFIDYIYSEEWFFETAAELEEFLDLEPKAMPVFGVDVYAIDYTSKEGEASFHMDSFTCSIAFSSAIQRDDAFERLSAKP